MLFIIGVSTLSGHDTAHHHLTWTTQHVSAAHCWTCVPWDMVTLLTRVVVSLDPLKQAWCSTSSDLIECYAMPVSAVCHWMCSPLDALRSRSVLGGQCVALTGRIHTCLICAVHHWTCWKDTRCCTTKVQSQSPTLSPCICSGTVAAFQRTGMWLACLNLSSQCSYVSFEQ